MLKRCTAREGCGRIHFVCVVVKNQKTPNLSPMVDDAITRGGIRSLGSPVYIYGLSIPVVELPSWPGQLALQQLLALL